MNCLYLLLQDKQDKVEKMDLNQLVDLMKIKPYLLRMGKGVLSRRYNASQEDIVTAKNMVKLGRHTPKVLLFDIETSPMRAYVWRLWKTDVHLEQVINEWFCIAWSAKWLYNEEIMGEVLTPEEIIREDDRRIMTSLWHLMNEADIVIAHNGNKFDIPRVNSRFIINGLNPTKPYFSIDTCQIAKKQFGFSSNKLDALAGYFNIPHKLSTDFDLWKRCLEGDKEALSYMLEYNKKDVAILEEVYLRLRPWIKNHPNMGNLSGDAHVCSNCGAFNVNLIKDKYYYTSIGKYSLYRCEVCGAISRGRKSISDSPSVNSVGK